MSTTVTSHISCPLLCFGVNYPPFRILLFGVVSFFFIAFQICSAMAFGLLLLICMIRFSRA